MNNGKRAKNTELYILIIWFVFALYIAFEGFRLKLGTLLSPGCGFLIFWTGIIVALLSMALSIMTIASKKEEKMLWKGLQWSKVIKVIVSLFIYTIVFKWLGFSLSTFLLLLFLFKGSKSERWGVVFMFSAATTIMSYVVFKVLLECPFPEDILEELVARLF